MKEFLERHTDKITGVLSCFDRLLFHGHLPLGYAEAMERFMSSQGLLFKEFKSFVTKQSERLKLHAQSVAERAGRPYQYLAGFTDKEDLVQAMIQKENLSEGLVCVLAAVEPCRSFTLRYGEKRPGLRAAHRKCLHFYFYFLDREFGLLHVRIQSWFPFQIQVCLNGHEWLARKLDLHGLAYHRRDNAFTWIADPSRAQKFADQMVKKNWPRLLNAFARRVNPLLQDLLQGNSDSVSPRVLLGD